MTKLVGASAQARELLNECYDGVLATLSVDVAGYPFGSVVPYCLNGSGQPIILIASIAQHTKNIREDTRVSLTVFDRTSEDLQSNGRVTVVGDAHLLTDEDQATAASRYYRFFPQSTDYHKTHDFAFYAIAPQRIRFIGGFGEIHWFRSTNVLLQNPFSAAEEHSIVAHMNADHAENVREYCVRAGYTVNGRASPTLVGCDAEGMSIRLGRRIVRIPFEAPVTDMNGARAAMAALVHRARRNKPI